MKGKVGLSQVGQKAVPKPWTSNWECLVNQQVSLKYGLNSNKKPGILCGWYSGRLDIRSAPGYITNFQKHAQNTSFLTFLLH